MKREEIVSGFPAARRGYDRDAVEAHLRRLAEEIERLETRSQPGSGSLAETAGEKIAGIIAAAEAKAAELEAEARSKADEIVAAAREEAAEQVRQARDAVSGLVQQADELRERIGELSRGLGGRALGAETPSTPGPVRVPEPEPPAPEVDPTPVVVPEPEPPREPEPSPVPEPVPQPDPVPAPTPLPQPPEEPPPAATNGEDAGARLVAMKMALEGSGRDEIAHHLAEHYELADVDGLLDDVLARVGK